MKALNASQCNAAAWWRIDKLVSLLSLLLLVGVSPRLAAQGNEWTWMSGSNTAGQTGVYGTKGVPAAGNVPGARYLAVGWTDASGNLWLFGGDGYGGDLNDLWKFTPSTGDWTWMSGSNLANQHGVYGTKGVPAAGNVPGAHYGAVSWTDASGNFWLFGGVSDAAGDQLNDLWKYTASTGEWTWMSGSNSVDQPGVYGSKGVPAPGNVPGARYSAVGWTDSSGNLWLFGGQGDLNDLWKYTPSTGDWTWMSGSNLANQHGVYGTKGVSATANVPGARDGALSWTDSSGNLWLFGGGGLAGVGTWGNLNDLWMFMPSTGEWTWMGGSNTVNQLGIYGTKGVPAASNVPGGRRFAAGWTDSSGNLWLFGGQRCDVGCGDIALNDLWKFTPSTGEWTWMSGSNSENQPGVYGTLGVPTVSNVPGARLVTVSWTDSSGNLWLFGGEGAAGSYFNDLWKYSPAPPLLTPSLTTPAPGSTLSGSAATFAWSNPGNLALRFVLRLGTTGLGSSDVLSGAATTGTSLQVSRIPTNGAYLYARLWYYTGTWQFVDANYTEAGTPTPPALTTPAPGSTLPGSTVTFGWNPGVGATRFLLRLGTTGLGSADVSSGAVTTATSVQVAPIPTNGAKLYTRLWYYLNGTWRYVDAIYTEASQ